MVEFFRELRRPGNLQPWVHAAHHRRAAGAGAFVRLPMPWLSLTLQCGDGGFWQDGQGRWQPFPRLALRGLFDAPSRALEAPGAQVDYALALLEPWATGPMFGIPGHALRNQVLDVEALLPDWAARLLDAAAPDPLAALLQALRERAMVDAPAALVRAARALQASSGGPLHELLDAPRTLRQRFASSIGLPPKRYARLLRFAASLRELHAQPWSLDFSSAPPAFADQSHQIHEFRRLAACTPAQYRVAKADGQRPVFTLPAALIPA